MPATRNEVIYECCPEPYLDITFSIKIRWTVIGPELSCDWLLQEADPVLLLQPDRALPADRLHGGARLHAAARLGGETLPG